MMNYSPQEIQIRVSLRCNILCRHCYNDSGPTQKLSLNLSPLKPLLETARARGIWRASLTGGEIFLFPDQIKEMLPMIKNSGLSCQLVTNGFWGKTEATALKMLTMIKDAGFDPTRNENFKLGQNASPAQMQKMMATIKEDNFVPSDQIHLSCGEYHREWISVETIKRAIEVHYRVFERPVLVSFEYGPKRDELFLKFQEELKSLPDHSYVITKHRIIFYRFGREIPLTIEETGERHWSTFNFPCGNDMNKIDIEPTGEIFPCCGFHKEPSLSIGNVFNENDPGKIIEAGNNNKMIRLIQTSTFAKLYAKLKEKHPELPETFAQKCEICKVLCEHAAEF